MSHGIIRIELSQLIPHESVWPANFISLWTRRTCKNAVKEFAAFHGIGSPEGLRVVDQAHVIAWRDALIEAGASERAINNLLVS